MATSRCWAKSPGASTAWRIRFIEIQNGFGHEQGDGGLEACGRNVPGGGQAELLVSGVRCQPGTVRCWELHLILPPAACPAPRPPPPLQLSHLTHKYKIQTQIRVLRKFRGSSSGHRSPPPKLSRYRVIFLTGPPLLDFCLIRRADHVFRLEQSDELDH